MPTNTSHTSTIPPVSLKSDGTSSVKTTGSTIPTVASGTTGDNAFLGLLVDGVINTWVCPSGSNYVVAATDVGKTLYIMNTGFKGNFTAGAYPIIGAILGANTVQRWMLSKSPAAVGSSGANWNIGISNLPYASGAIPLPVNSNCMVPADPCQISPAHQGGATSNPGMTFHMGGIVCGKSLNDE